MHVPRREVGPRARPGVLVFDPHRAARGEGPRGVPAASGLDAGLLVGGHDVLAGIERDAVPASFVKVQDRTGFARELRVPREDPRPVPPGPQRVLAEPAPQRRAADLRYHPVGHDLPTQLCERPARQGHAAAGWQLTREGLDLDDDAGGKSGLGARRAALPRGPVIAQGRTACATC
jgi:hypothetical protein